MSRMLVAYESCGCAAIALLDPTDEQEAARFRADCANDGLLVREEERERIGYEPCLAHGLAAAHAEALRADAGGER
jgi:hypothetical protein